MPTDAPNEPGIGRAATAVKPFGSTTPRELVHLIGHDLSGRVGNTASFMEIAQRALAKGDTDRAQELLERAASAGRASRAIIDRLVQLLGTPDEVGEASPVELEAVLDECAAALPDLEIGRSTPLPVVVVHEPTFRGALLEILDNAVRFADDSRGPVATVRVLMSAEGRHCAIEIRDNGRGIPPDKIARALEPGRRSTRTTACSRSAGSSPRIRPPRVIPRGMRTRTPLTGRPSTTISSSPSVGE